jgi:hypothetical protein
VSRGRRPVREETLDGEILQWVAVEPARDGRLAGGRVAFSDGEYDGEILEVVGTGVQVACVVVGDAIGFQVDTQVTISIDGVREDVVALRPGIGDRDTVSAVVGDAVGRSAERPPTAVSSAPFWMATPSPVLPRSPVPSARVPIRLPSILFSSPSENPETKTPYPSLPEMTLRSSGSGPPTVLEALATYTPIGFLRALVPSLFVPTKLPSILLPFSPEPVIRTPASPKFLITNPLIVQSEASTWMPLKPVPGPGPSSCTVRTESLPSSRVLGLAPSWV